MRCGHCRISFCYCSVKTFFLLLWKPKVTFSWERIKVFWYKQWSVPFSPLKDFSVWKHFTDLFWKLGFPAFSLWLKLVFQATAHTLIQSMNGLPMLLPSLPLRRKTAKNDHVKTRFTSSIQKLVEYICFYDFVMLQVWKLHGIFCSRNTACAFGGIMPSYYGTAFGFRISNVVWWVDRGWMLGGTKAPPLLSTSGLWERKYNKRLIARDKDTKRWLTSYCPRQNRLDLCKSIEFIIN